MKIYKKNYFKIVPIIMLGAVLFSLSMVKAQEAKSIGSRMPCPEYQKKDIETIACSTKTDDGYYFKVLEYSQGEYNEGFEEDGDAVCNLDHLDEVAETWRWPFSSGNDGRKPNPVSKRYVPKKQPQEKHCESAYNNLSKKDKQSFGNEIKDHPENLERYLNDPEKFKKLCGKFTVVCMKQTY